MRHDGPRVDLPRFERADDGADLLQRFEAERDAFFGGDFRPHIMEGRSRRGHAEAFAVQPCGRGDPRLIGRI